MTTSFTDDDVDKRVETAGGDRVGVVTMTEPETAYVDLEAGAVDSIKATLDWEGDADDVVPIDAGDVQAVTEETIRLAGGDEPRRTDEDATDPVFDREPDAVTDERSGEPDGTAEATGDASEAATDADDAGDGRSGEAMEPETEEMDEAGAERHPESEEQPPEGDRTVTKDRGREEDR
ncbi:hypothetical protein [Natronolimnohabitans innermongolicus]|uniref:Uncharacterized protein n=1 Tax=Natronolimnohabitans innermongolicus JCM 12255 TaxID=1227499 RepID=L9XE58_9EURY|nr:hypothetical protein [Natronolimnohabitans innermongolicus]ELY59989.1 hypothetical protein C493_04438 [Natronolimnohabitans innermongolicus JCM 12255]